MSSERSFKASSIPPPEKQATRHIGRRPRMSRFLRILLAATALIHAPFVVAVAEALRRVGFGSPWLGGLGFAAAGIFFFAGRARSGMYDQRKSRVYVMLVDIPYFIHWCACIFTLLVGAVGVVTLPLVDALRGVTIGFPAPFLMWTYALGLVVSGYGILVRRRWFVVREVDIPVKGLDPVFDGYRIAQLSDLHIGTMTPQSWGERWARAANRHAPDLAVVTGDLVTSGTAFYQDVTNVVSALKATDGVFVSMGNHDYFGDGEPLVKLLRAHGNHVLRNEGVILERDGAKIFLAAIDDTWTQRDDLPKALENRPPGVPTILLAHDPERFRAAAKAGVDLTLSGHTHGGQIAVPFLSRRLSLSHLTHHFHLGLYTKGDSTLYVHPGLGTTGPPIRIGVAPAVTILTLRAA